MSLQKRSNRNLVWCYYSLLVMSLNFAMAEVPEHLIDIKINEFSSKMIQEVAKNKPGKSIIVSAYTVLTPLAVLTLASSGSTHDELLNAIGFHDDNAIRETFRAISQEMNAMEKELTLAITYSLFIDTIYEINSEFIRDVNEIFQIDVDKLSPPSRRQSPDEVSRLLLTSYILFKGPWKHKFPTNNTSDRVFYKTDETTVTVPMMSVTGFFKYGLSQRLDSQVLELPYTDQSSMIIILPNALKGIVDLIPKIDGSILDEANMAMEKENVRMYIPKFKIEATFDLKNFLRTLNVNKIFSEEAEIDKILTVKEKLLVMDGKQSALIDVNEQGKEDPPPIGSNPRILEIEVPIFEFNANHPFVYFVRFNNKTLLSGLYY